MFNIKKLRWDDSFKEIKSRIKILSLDSGGIRGLFSLYILRYICRMIYNSSGKSSTKEFISNFDLIIGSSTGGLNAVGLCAGKSIDELIESYHTMSGSIFSGNKYVYNPVRYLRYLYEGNFYNLNTLRDIIEKDYDSRYMFSVNGPKVLVPLVQSKSIILSRSYTNVCNSIPGTSSMTIRDTLISTCINTDYFCPIGDILSDSTIECPNPSEVSIIEAYDIFKTGYPHLLLSIGTGVPDFDDDDIESEIVHQRTSSWCKLHNVLYFRFNPPKIRTISGDEYRDFVLENGEIITLSYMKSIHDQVCSLIKTL